MSKIRLYESALNDVRYVYGSPVKFSADRTTIEIRERDKALMEQRQKKENAK